MPVQGTAGFVLVKHAVVHDLDSDGITDLGDTITWTFTVTNAGTTTVSGIAVNDPRAGAVTCPQLSLAPGAQMICTAADYVITQSDVDAGRW